MANSTRSTFIGNREVDTLIHSLNSIASQREVPRRQVAMSMDVRKATVNEWRRRAITPTVCNLAEFGRHHGVRLALRDARTGRATSAGVAELGQTWAQAQIRVLLLELRLARRAQGVRSEEVASDVRVSVWSLRHMEMGHFMPMAPTLALWALALGKRLCWVQLEHAWRELSRGWTPNG